jgi:SHS2 domain-containing protein
MGVNPINFANAQVRFLVEDEVKDDDSDDKLDDVIKNLIYKFPTRGRITRARYEMEYGEQNVKTSIYNKKANTIKDE